MKASPVAFVNIPREEGGVQKGVERAMALVDWQKYVKGESIFVKINAMSKEVIPGINTSPWVFEAVLKIFRDAYPHIDIYFGDGDVSASRQVDKAVHNWGFLKIAKKYKAKFINLSSAPVSKVNMGKIFPGITIPSLLLEVNQIVSLPILKTHCITPFTGALKNQWGLLPRVRFQYHSVVHQAIAEINRYFSKTVFAVMDATIAQEGPGPRCGIPKICDAIFASPDLVALDSLAASYIGMDPEEIGFIKEAEAQGVGSSRYEVVGDNFKVNPFKPGESKDYFVYRLRDRLNKNSIFSKILLSPAVYRLAGYFVGKYNKFIWYRKYGRAYVKKILSDDFYRRQFQELIPGNESCAYPLS